MVQSSAGAPRHAGWWFGFHVQPGSSIDHSSTTAVLTSFTRPRLSMKMFSSLMSLRVRQPACQSSLFTSSSHLPSLFPPAPVPQPLPAPPPTSTPPPPVPTHLWMMCISCSARSMRRQGSATSAATTRSLIGRWSRSSFSSRSPPPESFKSSFVKGFENESGIPLSTSLKPSRALTQSLTAVLHHNVQMVVIQERAVELHHARQPSGWGERMAERSTCSASIALSP